jgi:Ca-activated chloride channel homolog
MKKPWIALALCWGVMFAAHAQDSVRLRLPRITAPEASQPIEIASLRVDAEIVGRNAQTRIELELRNPNSRVLEAQLHFPLEARQTVSGFALDIEGELRSAVPVEKAKGRQVFEDVTRTRTDPALLESTQGNNYALRIYPIQAMGTRRVVLQLVELLDVRQIAGRAIQTYRLPLQFDQAIGQLQLSLRLPGSKPEAVHAAWGPRSLSVQHSVDQNSATVRYSAERQQASTLTVQLPSLSHSELINAQDWEGQRYVVADVAAPSSQLARPKPKHIAVIWDASGSASARSHFRELRLLDAYLRYLVNVSVDLHILRDAAEPVQHFDVRGGRWDALRTRLDAIVYDGASNLSAIPLAESVQLALMFSDGLHNFGVDLATKPPVLSVPLFILNSASASNAANWRPFAQASGGDWVDLTDASMAFALEELTVGRWRLASVLGSGVEDIVLASRFASAGRIEVGARQTDPNAQIELEWLAPSGQSKRQSLRLAVSPANLTVSSAQRWARMRLAGLMANPELNRAAITRLGRQFGLVTPGTSLIVLDALADYVRYDIVPPIPMQAAYEKALAQRAATSLVDRAKRLDRLAERFRVKQAWWNQEFPKDAPPRVDASKEAAAAGSAPGASPPPRMAAPAVAAMAPAPGAAVRSKDATSSSQAPSLSIRLAKWQADAPYIKRIREASAEQIYAIYLDERPAYVNSSAFFLDVADILFDRGQIALGVRVLSNLAEMNLENRHLLRILAYRLSQAGMHALALPQLQRVLDLSPDEPQSYRDLGLALAKLGRSQEAIQSLWEVVVRPWAGRFPDIELIALAELNAIIATSATALDVSAFDPRLLHNLPLALRAVLAWDADNTDIDLWVIDPNGERAFYGRQLTYQGGRMSADFTGGYGPEEFSLRLAKPGKYTVKAQFYGHNQQIVAPATSLMLRLSTGFGTKSQVDQDVILRLQGAKQEVTVGSFEVH